MSASIRIVLSVLLALAAAQTLGQNAAANYPTKPIRWIIDFPPAGVSDILTRTVGQRLTEYLGQVFVYDNRPGANGIIANALVAKAPPDGYTLGFISQPLSLQLTLIPNLSFGLKDFAPVALIAEYPSLLVVQAKTPVETAKEFTAWAKKKSPSITYASSGAGGAQHLAMELFRKVAGFDAVHVPYTGSAAGMIDLMGGRVDAVFVNVPGSLPHIRAGRVKAIALAGRARDAARAEAAPLVAAHRGEILHARHAPGTEAEHRDRVTAAQRSRHSHQANGVSKRARGVCARHHGHPRPLPELSCYDDARNAHEWTALCTRPQNRRERLRCQPGAAYGQRRLAK